MLKKIIPFFVMLMLVCTVNRTALAADIPDLTQQGSIEITMKKGDTVVPGGTLTIYQVAAAKQENGNYYFELTGTFAAYGKEITDFESAQLAQELAGYIKNSAGKKQTVDENGKVRFADLPCGLYLLVQDTAASGYEKVLPFLVTVPIKENGSWVYDVDASPKVELEQEETEPETKPSQITTGGGSTLPQTGQLNWPVPLLAVSGLLLFVIGWLLRTQED